MFHIIVGLALLPIAIIVGLYGIAFIISIFAWIFMIPGKILSTDGDKDKEVMLLSIIGWILIIAFICNYNYTHRQEPIQDIPIGYELVK